MFTCNSFNSLILHMGNSQMQFKLLLGPFKIALMSFIINLMHQLNCHASSHVCALCHVNWLLLHFPCVVWFLSIDDDVGIDDLYVYASVELAQHQAVEWAGKYSLTWTIVPVPHLLRILSVVFLLALLFDACLDPITCHPAAMNIALPPHLQPCCLWPVSY